MFHEFQYIMNLSRTILAFLLSIQNPFVVEIEFGVVDKKTKQNKNISGTTWIQACSD